MELKKPECKLKHVEEIYDIINLSDFRRRRKSCPKIKFRQKIVNFKRTFGHEGVISQKIYFITLSSLSHAGEISIK